MNKSNGKHAFDTRLIHAGEAPDPVTGANGVPLYQNNTFAFRSWDQVASYESGQTPHYVYQRYGNPTVRCLELKLANLEGAEQCAAAATGMAAITATLLELTGSGCHIITASDLYQVTEEVLETDLPRQGTAVTVVDIRDHRAVEHAMTPATRLIFCETLSNPGLQIADLPMLAEIAHRGGALLVVDNTFLSPALLRPLEHGADLVLHSSTKYLAGTGQVMGGFASGCRDLVQPIANRLSRTGATMTPFAAWMHLAGIKTLSLRMERHSVTAARLARMLVEHPATAFVHFPLSSDQHGFDRLNRQTGGRFGGLLSFRLQGGVAAAKAFVDALQICTIAVSLGEPETLIWPLQDQLLRLAVGLEDPADLEGDLARGLAAASVAAAEVESSG